MSASEQILADGDGGENNAESNHANNGVHLCAKAEESEYIGSAWCKSLLALQRSISVDKAEDELRTALVWSQAWREVWATRG